MVSSPKLVGKVSSLETQPENAEVQHADTCADGKTCYIEHYLDQYYIVDLFLDLYGVNDVPIVNALYRYHDQDVQY